ncbi:hypothetical protein ACTGJ5_07600 [Streptococcus suis]
MWKEAAAIDGASRSQQFFNIELPFLLPSISMVFNLGNEVRFDSI